MQKQQADARRVVAVAVAEQKHLEQQIAKQRSRLDASLEDAENALRAGREDRARQALERHQSERDHLRVLEEEHSRHGAIVEELRERLRTIQSDIQRAQQKRELILPRLRDREIRVRVRNLIGELGDGAARDVFDLLEELSREVPERDSAAEVAALTEPTADEMLEDLKLRLGLRDEE
jgi:phage shock protein A